MTLAIGPAQQREELAPELRREYWDGQKEVRMAARNPACLIEGEAACGHETMQMRMWQQLLIPGMQDRQKTELCPQTLRISGDRQQGLRNGTEQNAVDHSGVLQREGDQLMRQSEDYMAVRNR